MSKDKIGAPRRRGPKPRRLTARQRRSLETAAGRLRAAEDRTAAARAELVQRIVDAHADGAGASVREIATAVGLSSARVGVLLTTDRR
jgi:hypothetical protein